jgi:hypothetical protein
MLQVILSFMSIGVPKDLSECRSFFLEPATAKQRMYEALRAYFVEERPFSEVAQDFGYSPGSFQVLCHHFRRDLNPIFFVSTRPGPRSQPKKSAARDLIVRLRKQNHSVYEISETLTKASLGIRPDQVPSFLALTAGGKKALFTTRQAIRLLEVHDNLGELLHDISAVCSHPMRRQLAANEKVLLGRLDGMRIEEAACQRTVFAGSELVFIRDDENSAGILREYGFWSLVRLLPRSMTTAMPASAEVKREAAYQAIRDEAGMRKLEARISKSEACALDTEASDKDPRSAVQSNTLFAAPFDLRRLEVTGAPQSVLHDVSVGPQGNRNVDFSQTGTVAYVSGKELPGKLVIFWMDSVGRVRPLHLAPGSTSPHAFRLTGSAWRFRCISVR